ncbi:helix-turn-helix protein [Bacteroides heparinolyticus]|uniref:Helix-turn-helix protein n=1 Tax=Prevotella heparinolytica TaxID=28113 RepID=A0A4R2LKK7_9BACE|nr:helix-turn-helix protein [Bacteroides heparinolyticus]
MVCIYEATTAHRFLFLFHLGKCAEFDEEAYAFYTGQILLDARKNARLTQEELAKRIGTDKSYISRIEKGITVPSVATFYRIVNALGLNVELKPTL